MCVCEVNKLLQPCYHTDERQSKRGKERIKNLPERKQNGCDHLLFFSKGSYINLVALLVGSAFVSVSFYVCVY